jgi:hypothetical protein
LKPVNIVGNAYPIAPDAADIMSAIAVAVAGRRYSSEAAEIAKAVDGDVMAFQTAELDDRAARVEQLSDAELRIAMGGYITETNTPVSRLLTNAFVLTPCARRGGNHKPSLDESSTIGSIALTLALLEAQSLRSHALHLFIKCVNFLIEPRVLRFRRIAAAQLFERLLNGEFGGFGHGNPSSLF